MHSQLRPGSRRLTNNYRTEGQESKPKHDFFRQEEPAARARENTMDAFEKLPYPIGLSLHKTALKKIRIEIFFIK